MESLERKKEEIVASELQNIAKLEQDKASPNPNDFLFDLSSERLVVEDEFD